MRSFKKIYIEITNVCNLSCNFCPKTNRAKAFMEDSAFEHILEQIKPYTKHIYFHLMGEPLLHPRLMRLLELSKHMGFKVNMTTNGTLINEWERLLLTAPALRQINISLSSFEANENVGALDEYIENIIQFLLRVVEESDKIISLRLWNMDSSKLKGNNHYNMDILNMLNNGLKLDFNIEERLGISNSVRLKNKLYLNMAEKFEWPNIDRSDSETKIFCYGLRDQIGILVDGTVVPCCLDSEGSISLGNLFDMSLKEIIESRRAENIYNGFSNRSAVEELCQKCGYAERFSRNE